MIDVSIRLDQLAQAMQVLATWRQVLGVLIGACAYWLVPERLRRHALLPISLLVLWMGFERWPGLLLAFLVAGAGVYYITKAMRARGLRTNTLIVVLTVLYVLLHLLLNILIFTDWLAWTGITAPDVINQCGTAVMFGYLRLWQYARDGEEQAMTLRDILAWLFFFPLFSRLPLIRSHEIFTLRSPSFARAHARRALIHGAICTGKSLLIAAIFAFVPQINAVQSPQNFAVWEAWVGLFASVMMFYLAFSGNVDFAIASAALLGFNLPDNFASLGALLRNTRARDFWRNWNFSVRRWLQDYIYTPAGGFRKHPLRNTMLTMIFCGLWHSVSPLGLFWGAGFGGLMLMEHGWTRVRLKYFKSLPNLPWPMRAGFWLMCFALLQIAQIPFSYQDGGARALVNFYRRLSGF